MRPTRLKVDNGAETVPRLIQGHGRLPGRAGEWGLVLLPTAGIGMLVAEWKDPEKGPGVWHIGSDGGRGGDGPRPPRPGTVGVMEAQLTALRALRERGERAEMGDIALRGEWRAWMHCTSDGPVVELHRKMGGYIEARLESDPTDGSWAWTLARKGRWHGEPDERTGSGASLRAAIEAVVQASVALAGASCGVRDTRRRGALDADYTGKAGAVRPSRSRAGRSVAGWAPGQGRKRRAAVESPATDAPERTAPETGAVAAFRRALAADQTGAQLPTREAVLDSPTFLVLAHWLDGMADQKWVAKPIRDLFLAFVLSGEVEGRPGSSEQVRAAVQSILNASTRRGVLAAERAARWPALWPPFERLLDRMPPLSAGAAAPASRPGEAAGSPKRTAVREKTKPTPRGVSTWPDVVAFLDQAYADAGIPAQPAPGGQSRRDMARAIAAALRTGQHHELIRMSQKNTTKSVARLLGLKGKSRPRSNKAWAALFQGTNLLPHLTGTIPAPPAKPKAPKTAQPTPKPAPAGLSDAEKAARLEDAMVGALQKSMQTMLFGSP